MSEPDGDGSDLTSEGAPLNQTVTPNEPADFLPDTASNFETWIAELKPVREAKSSPPACHVSQAQLKFEGTLWVDSYLAYLLRSQTGTLVVSETGQVESDIAVAVAIIDGHVRGNIRATERVELQSHARVFGDIESPAVAIQTGAVFEGQCRGNNPAQNPDSSE